MGARSARRYVVTGLVQGVGFRWTVRDVARSLGVTGTVRNLPDGSVEITAHGAPEALDRLQRALRARMPGRVESVRVDPIETSGREGTPDDFRIGF